jgi:hypothetical protein
MGEKIFTENEIPVFVEWFEWVGGGGTFGNCHVIDGDPTFGTGQAIWTSNINLRFDLTSRFDNVVRFHYHDSGGNENLGVNGYPLFVGEILSATVPANFIILHDNLGSYNQVEIINMNGYITELVVGGQEFMIDNICTDFYFAIDEPQTGKHVVSLGANYPNPISGHTTIPFVVKERVILTVCIFDHYGREIAVLANGEFQPGDYELNWIADGFSSGIYFYQLRTGSDILSRKMVVE